MIDFVLADVIWQHHLVKGQPVSVGTLVRLLGRPQLEIIRALRELESQQRAKSLGQWGWVRR